MGQGRSHSFCSALPSEWLVEPVALEAGAILVVAVAVEAILVAAVAAKVVVAVLEEVAVAALEAVVELAQVELERERVALELRVVAARVDAVLERRVWEAMPFFQQPVKR